MRDLTKKLLAVTASVILASTAMLSGCGSVEGDSDDKAPKVDNVTDSAKTAVEAVGNTLSTVKDMATGEIDKAYSGSITVGFGKPVAQAMGVDRLGDIKLSSDTKAKAGDLSATLSLGYDGNDIISAEIIREEETGRVFIGSPELNDGYLYLDSADLEALADEMGEEMDIDLGSLEQDGTNALAKLDSIDIDEEALEESLDGYLKIVEDKLPDTKDGEKVSGEIDGIKYTLDTKKMDVSGGDVNSILTAICEKAKTDDALLSLIDQFAEISGEASLKEEFINEINAALEEGFITGEDADEVASFDIYYNDGEFSGIGFANPDNPSDRMEVIWYVNGDECCGMYSLTESESGSTQLIKGSAKIDDGATDVNISVDIEELSMSFSIDDLKIVDEESGAFTGDIAFTYAMSGDESTSFEVTLKSESTSKKLDLSGSVKVNGEEYITVDVVGKETKATDMKIPSGKLYKLTDDEQTEQYLESIDSEKLMSTVKDALGDELYTALFNSSEIEDDWEEEEYWDEAELEYWD